MDKSNKCPLQSLFSFNFDSDKIKNIMLIVLAIKSICEMFKSKTPDLDINDFILSNLQNIGDNITPQFNVPSIPPIKVNDSGTNNIYNLIFLGFFIYIFFFIKDFFEGVNLFSVEINNHKKKDINQTEKKI